MRCDLLVDYISQYSDDDSATALDLYFQEAR